MDAISKVHFRDICGILSEYDFYRMLPDGLVPMGPYKPLLYELYAYQNIVAIRRGSDFCTAVCNCSS